MSKNIAKFELESKTHKAVLRDVNVMQSETIDMSGNVLNQSRLFARMLLDAQLAGYLRLTSKQKLGLTNWVNRPKVVKNYDVLTNSSYSLSRFRYVNGTGMKLDPLVMSNKSSRLLGQYSTDFLLANNLHQYRNNTKKDLVPYFVTLTTPNADLGTLGARLDEHCKRVSTFMSRLKDGARGKNNYNFEGAKYSGGVSSTEITESALREGTLSRDPKGVFHHHTHILLLLDRTLSDSQIERIGSQLFGLWQSLNPNYKLSPDAFDFEIAYDSDDEDGDRGFVKNTTSALNEALKYALKPTMFKDFAKYRTSSAEDKRFMLQVVAELYKATYSRHLVQSYGSLRLMRSVQNALKPFGNVISMGLSRKFGVPVGGFVTRNMTLKYSNYKLTLDSERQLLTGELVYYNRSILERSIIDQEDLAQIIWLADKMLSHLGDSLTTGHRAALETLVSLQKYFANNLETLYRVLGSAKDERDPYLNSDIEAVTGAIKKLTDPNGEYDYHGTFAKTGCVFVPNYGSRDKALLANEIRLADTSSQLNDVLSFFNVHFGFRYANANGDFGEKAIPLVARGGYSLSAKDYFLKYGLTGKDRLFQVKNARGHFNIIDKFLTTFPEIVGAYLSNLEFKCTQTETWASDEITFGGVTYSVPYGFSADYFWTKYFMGDSDICDWFDSLELDSKVIDSISQNSYVANQQYDTYVSMRKERRRQRQVA